MENPKIEIREDFLIIGDRKLKISELFFLLNNSDRLEQYSAALTKAVFSLAQVSSFILTSPKLDDEDRTRGGEGLPSPDTFFYLEILGETLKKLEYEK